MLELIWHFQVQVLPVLLGLLIFESLGLIRRRRKLYYVPIYFTFFPLSELNPDLSIYVGDDFYYGTSANLSESQRASLRRKIVIVSVVSMTVAAIVTPLYTGFLAAFFMTPSVLLQFVLVLLIIKVLGIAKAIRDFGKHAVGTKRNKLLLGVIYFVYLGVVVEMLRSSYYWARPYIDSQDWGGLLSSLSSLLFGKIAVNLLIIGVVTALVVSLITERKLRDGNG